VWLLAGVAAATESATKRAVGLVVWLAWTAIAGVLWPHDGPRTERSRDPEVLMRRSLVVTGVGLTVGFACAMIAALHPSLSSVWNANGVHAVTLIGHDRGAWQLANWMFAVGIGFTLAGLAALTGLLNRESPGSPQPSCTPMKSALRAVMPDAAPKAATAPRVRARVCSRALRPDAATTAILTMTVRP